MSKPEVTLQRKNGWLSVDDNTRNNIFTFCSNYASFIDKSKTEREAVREAEAMARANNFADISTLKEWKPGEKVFFNHRGKALCLAVLGKKTAINGVHIVAAHVDAPRIDLKPYAIREDENFALLETHYYGGIKKYQWLATPLAMHGIVMRADGTEVELRIGEDPADPVFYIPDVLPHLGKVQIGKTVSDAFPGEELDIIAGSVPLQGEEKDAVKKAILNLLNEKYGMIEEDFISAEIEIVPAHKARDIGFDRGMLGAYGQDDRVCSYAAVRALLDSPNIPDYTSIVVLADKEEIGSMGTSGMESKFIDMFVSMLISVGKPNFNPLDVHIAWDNTKVLSADVNAGVDPVFKSVHEMSNAARMGQGPCISKYTGSRGKSGSNDASAEFVGQVRRLFNQAGVKWQMAELGKVDEGGGGTVAYLFANRGADVIDIGTPLHNMHSLFEVASKFDIYHTYLACKAFFEVNWR